MPGGGIIIKTGEEDSPCLPYKARETVELVR